MVFHEPPRGGSGGTVGATHRGIGSVLFLFLLAATACARTEFDLGESFDDDGAAGKAGGASTGGRAGAAGGSNGVGGGAVIGGASAQAGSGAATGHAGSSGASGSGGAVENCSNGIDDDRDGNIDCAD